MDALFLLVVCVALAIFLPAAIPDYFTISDKHVTRAGEQIPLGWIRMPLRGGFFFVALLLLANTSYVIIGSDKIGSLSKVYGFTSLQGGRIIAVDGETGPQAKILGPGLNFKPLLNVLYKVESTPVHEVPLGSYGMITAKDGLPLRAGQNFADRWKEGDENNMLKAEYFLGEGKGQKGPQSTILKPGKYRYNPYLLSIQNKPARKVAPGYVGVVKSMAPSPQDMECAPVPQDKGVSFSVRLVPENCRGIWSKVLAPGVYYMNESAYKITSIPSRVQTIGYVGGYTKRWIDLTVRQDGQIDQKVKSEGISIPASAADNAIMLKVDGWEVPIEMRVLVQVDPANAPVIFAAIGDLEQLEEKIFTPLVRSVVKNIVSAEYKARGEAAKVAKGTMVLELRDKRAYLEEKVLATLRAKAAKFGLIVRDVRFGDPVIPPELLVARKREHLAKQMQQTFIEEEAAQKKRIEVEKAIAEADQQAALMEAKIEEKSAKHRMAAKEFEGKGEKLKLQEIAKGQSAQVAVLGKDKTMQLAVIDKLLDAAVKNPAIVKVPRVQVQSGSGVGSLEGAFAILGDSNLTKGMVADPESKN